MTMAGRDLAAAALLVVTLAACQPSAGLGSTIALENRTSTPVAVEINGTWAGTYPAGAVANVPIAGHGSPPYRVEVRSPSGTLLSELTIQESDVQQVAQASTNLSVGNAVACGWIQLSYGVRVAPSAGVPAQDPTGPCP